MASGHDVHASRIVVKTIRRQAASNFCRGALLARQSPRFPLPAIVPHASESPGHLETSTWVWRGRRGTCCAWWRAWSPLVARGAAPLCVAGVVLGHIHLRLAWQAWQLKTFTCVWGGRRSNFVIYHLSHTNSLTHHLSHIISPTQLCHTLFPPHNFVTHSLSHNTIFHAPSHSHNFVTHHLSHRQLCHRLSFSHHLTHTTLSQTIFHHTSHTIFRTPFTHHFVTHHLSPHHLTATCVTQLFHTTLSVSSFLTSLCGVLVFDSVSRSRPPAPVRPAHHTIFHTQLCHTHTPSLSHTIFHTPLCHTPSFTHHDITFVSRCMRGTW